MENKLSLIDRWIRAVRVLGFKGAFIKTMRRVKARFPRNTGSAISGADAVIYHNERSKRMSRVSVVIPFYNAGSYLVDAVESVKAQEFPFKDLSLYLIDDGSTDESRDIGEGYARIHANIAYVRQENKGVSAARNKGIEFAIQEGSEFTFFLDADDMYEKSHIQKCINLLEQYPESVFVSGVMHFFEAENGLSRRYRLPQYQKTREIKPLNDNADALYVGHVAQGGWRTSILKEHRFNEDLDYSEDIDLLCRILSEHNFVFSKEIAYRYRIRSAKDSVVNVGGTKLQWYSRVWNVFRPLYANMIEQHGTVPFFVQQTVIENLCSLFADAGIPEITSQIDYAKLDEAVRFIMRNTDESILEFVLLDHWHKMYFYTFKLGEPAITRWAPLPTFVMNDTGGRDEGKRFGYLGSDPLFLHIAREKEGILTIRASMRCITYQFFALDVKADFETAVTEVPAPLEREKLYFCGREIFPRKYYEIKINLRKPTAQSTKTGEGLIRFFLTTDYSVSVCLPLEAVPLAGIGYNMPFMLGDEFIIKRTKHINILKAAPFTETELLETCPNVMPFAGLGAPDKKSVGKFNNIKNHIIKNYRAFCDRRIWVFMDRANETGNNAEALFRHCVAKDDGIQKYYIIPDESCAERFEGLPYMIFGTLEYQLLCCFAEKFISSFLYDEGITLHFGVDRSQKELFEDIRNFKKLARAFFRGDIIHIQHGIIMQDISFYLNKFDEETRLLFNVSQREHDYVRNALKHAVDEKILRLTGLPMFDTLERIKNNPDSQKIVLFAPSFDRRFALKGAYNPAYKSSEHFKYLNSVLQSGELLDLLEKNGYTLYFRPHTWVVEQLADFDLDPRIIVSHEANRYDLFAMSDLMITDYSGIAFEFAYLKKPVLYAHMMSKPKFDESYFSYEADGFGEICSDMAELTKAVSKYVQKGCVMSGAYKKRVDDFFSFQDGQNCERIYQEILKLPDTRKNIFK